MKRIALLFAALLAYSGLALAVVNINSATAEQLATLDGIGPVKAQAIIDYRKKNGPFKKIDDIKKVDGVGDATFANIKKDLVLSGTTTGAGKPAEKKAADTAEKKVDKAAATAEKKVDKAAEKTKETAKDTKAAAKSTADKAEKKVDAAADKTAKKVDAAADKAEKKVEEKKK